MKYFRFLLIGFVFGIVMYKSQAVSWYRIYEMFRFESFHMYGIIMSAVVLGAILVAFIKKTGARDFQKNVISIVPKEKGFTRYLIGGSLFGLGWALVGACPGPMFVLVGTGTISILVVIAFATIGTFVYGLLKDKLPH